MSRRGLQRTALAGVLAAVMAMAAVTAVSAAGNGTWTDRAPSGFKRQEVTFQQSGGKMYLAGGMSDVQQVYNPATDTWSNVAPLPAPVPMDHIQSAAVNGKIYYIGGLTGWPGPSVGDVYVYDTATDTFSAGAPMPAGRDRGAGGTAAYNGKIYVAGGIHDGTTVGWFDVYDPASNTWASLPDLPHRRDHFQAAIVNGRFWAIGGRVSSTPLRVGYNEAFDLTTQKWLTGFAPLPTLRGGVATAVFGNEIAVIGGEGGGATFSTVEAYDTVSNTWRTLAPMPTSRHGIQAAMLDGSAYIADGGTKQGGGSPTDVQEVLTVASAYQPDAQVKLSGDASFVGDNVYNTTGTGQQRDVSSTDGAKRSFVVRVQNDGGSADGFSFLGCGSANGFTVRYFAGATGTKDVTSAVMGGTYMVTAVAPGSTRAVRLEITTGSATPNGATQLCRTTATSKSSTSVADAVVATDTAN